MENLDLEKFKILDATIPINQEDLPEVQASKRRPRTEPYFWGDIPLVWFHSAANTPGRGFHVAMGIWHQRTLRKSDTVKLSGKGIRLLGVGRNSMYRALIALEAVGLISVTRAPGKCPRVRVLVNVEPRIISPAPTENFNLQNGIVTSSTGPPN